MRPLLATAGVLGLFAALYLVPVIAPGQLYALHILTLALCYAVPAIGLNLLFGYTWCRSDTWGSRASAPTPPRC